MTKSYADKPVVVMTLMVRDEIDILAPWLEYHLMQGLDRIIVTDNASVDGTYELLRTYADRGLIDLRTHPVHDKKQFAVVTQMARDAFLQYGADWVLNSDADEFWVVRGGETVARAVRRLPADGEAFPVPVTNMTGPPLLEGSSLRDHIWRDERSLSELHTVGLHSQPTHNLIHPGSPDVRVAQGNHFTSQPHANELPEGSGIEVLHFPLRTWAQYKARVIATGEAYSQSPELHPSPRHHTMRDYRWWQAGILEPFFVARHPDLHSDSSPVGFTKDTRVRDQLLKLEHRDGGAEILTDGLRRATPYPAEREENLRGQFAALGALIVDLEDQRVDDLSEVGDRLEAALTRADQLGVHNDLQHARIKELESDLAEQKHVTGLLRSSMTAVENDNQRLRDSVLRITKPFAVRAVLKLLRVKWPINSTGLSGSSTE